MSPADHFHDWAECQSGGEFEEYGWPCGQCLICGEFGPLERVRMNPRTVIVHTVGSVRGSDIKDRDRLTAWEWVTLTGVTLAGVAVAGIVGLFALDLLWLYLGAVASLGEAVGR